MHFKKFLPHGIVPKYDERLQSVKRVCIRTVVSGIEHLQKIISLKPLENDIHFICSDIFIFIN